MSLVVKRLIGRAVVSGMLLCATVVAGAAAAPHTQAAVVTTTTQASVTLSPSSGPALTSVLISGSGFQANDSVRVYWGSYYVAQGTTDATGAFMMQFTAPHRGGKGPVTVTAIDSVGPTGVATFTVM